MTQKAHVMHGRDHLPTGADPIPGLDTVIPTTFTQAIDAITDDVTLLGWWRLGDGSSPYVDSSPLLVPGQTARNLTRTTGTTSMTLDYTPGGLPTATDDGAVAFNAANNASGDYLSTAGDTRFDRDSAAEALSLVCLVKPFSSASTFYGVPLGNFFAVAPNSWPGGFGILVSWPTRTVEFRQGNAGSSSTTWVTVSGGVLPANVWSLIVATYDGSSTSKLYVNGSLVGTASGAATKNSSGASASMYAGRSTVAASSYAGSVKPGAFYGGVDEASVWAGELTAEHVALLIDGVDVGSAASISSGLKTYVNGA